ncbi:MAG TPA: glycoside hydrolase family 3 C-terminal domain-containing protein [Acidobacteriaceae bacterium]|nr:glycoside hydrolase family 3 C-terminal domain-containing protein [Acidobacteriaceae bacterium]
MSAQSFKLAALSLCLAVAAPLLHAQQQPLNDPPVPDSPAIEKRVDAMITRLTLKQKLELIGGVDGMYIRAEPSVGFPRLKMSDASMGVRTWGPDTAYAGGIALAASWDPKLAHETGVSTGDDARARGVNFLLGPGVDIYRAPMNGRNFEYLGEDPYLAAQTAVAYIEGVQSQGVIATVKHFAANDEEYDRHNVSSDVDERTLREIDLPAFEAAVKVAHVGAVMDSYNLLNGVHSTQNHFLNVQVLRNDWHFNGILMSDWDATYSAVGAANNGLDLEMPSGKFMNPQNLMPAIKDGQVSEATINQKVRRIFRTAIRFHFLDRPQLDLNIPLDSPFARHVALQGALESITLLKNEGHLLPLDESKIHTLAVFGPDAWPAVPGGGGSSQVTPFQASSIMTGLSNYLGHRVNVLYARGLPTADDIFSGTDFVGRAVKAEVFNNPNFNGTPQVIYVPRIASFKSEEWTPPAKIRKSIRMTAEYMPQTTGTYLVLAGAGGSDAYTIYIDGKQVLEQPHREGQAPQSAEVQLTAGTPAQLRVDYLPDASYPRIGVGIIATSKLVSPEVAKIAAMADAAVVAVGFDPETESEGFDRSYTLPFGQDELIQAVAAANKNTIVTLTAGGGVDTHRWINDVPAFIDNYYPGQAGGKAFAEIIFGEHSPEGHLPFSFARSWQQNPVHDCYYAAPVPAGQIPHIKYCEGVFLGYRYYTTKHIQPLYPFGYGLSYTTFLFSNLKVTPEDASPDGPITVSFDVTNTGSRAGADVAQLYVGDPSAKLERPVKELKGYEKVRLEPGKTEHVTLALNRRSLAYWSVATNNWQVDPGKFIVYVGDSSDYTPLAQAFEIK